MSRKEEVAIEAVASMQKKIDAVRKGSRITRIMRWDSHKLLIEAPASEHDMSDPYFILDEITKKFYPCCPTEDMERFRSAQKKILFRLEPQEKSK